ncbi:TetR family transcriptional regulator C-terminal domain-containing protein [Micrococcales bacterium 31B]|nr:TetR family transcriptional regulator C-terminal domain-containing protein [Micrococcales bacterium 31B]
MPKKIDLDARRTQLAEAVWTVARDQGIGHVSVRTVAAQAGVAVGSLRHVFPTRAELMQFSAELMLSRAAARVKQLPLLDNPIDMAVALLREGLPLTPESRTELQVNLALVAEAPSLPSLASVRDKAHSELVRGITSLTAYVAPRLSPERCSDEARRLTALVDGLALHMLNDNGPSQEWAEGVLRSEIERLAGLAE